jgi:mannose-6-phosphate isomerase-like protein (cupin superfamily)
MKIDKPWGYEDIVYVGPRYVFKKLFMKKGESCSLQFHREKHETVLVFSGLIKIEFGPNAEALAAEEFGPGETLVLDPGVVHKMTALVDSVYFEASTPELEDVVRLEDKYGRADPKS